MKHKLLTLASAAALLAACSDSSVSDANDEIKQTSTVTFMVVDNFTNLPLEDVSVYFRPTDETKKTDSAGTSVWKNVELGSNIYWDFSLEGYASKRHFFTLVDDISNDVARMEDQHPRIDMFELGVTAKGKFYYTDIKTGDWKPAEGVTVFAKYADPEIYPNEIYTKTDAEGAYEFKNMAAGADFEVTAMRFILDSTVVYEQTQIKGAVNERKGVVKELDAKAAPVAGLVPVLLEKNLKAVDSTSALKLTFSEVLEKDSVKTKNVYVEDNNGNLVAVVTTLSDDGKTISVKPASGKWVDGNDYKVFFSVWSKLDIEDEDATGFRGFSVGNVKVPANVKNIQLDTTKSGDVRQDVIISFDGARTFVTLNNEDADDDTIGYNANIVVIWDEIEKGVQGFNVYVKGDRSQNADFVLLKTELGGSVHKTTVNLADAFNNGNDLDFPLSKKQVKEVEIMVLPFSSVGEAIASDAKTVKVNVGERAEKKMAAMEGATLKSFADLKYSTGSTCSDAKTCTPGALKADIFTDDYFEMTLGTRMASSMALSISSFS